MVVFLEWRGGFRKGEKGERGGGGGGKKRKRGRKRGRKKKEGKKKKKKKKNLQNYRNSICNREKKRPLNSILMSNPMKSLY